MAQDRSALLESLGVPVTALPYELHPETPRRGIDLSGARPGGRTDAVYGRIEAECAEVGLSFRRPQRVPNTAMALEAAEHVRQRAAGAFAAFDRSLFSAHFVEGLAIDDLDVVAGLAEKAGADGDELRRCVEAGTMAASVRASMDAALEAGVSGTPAWLLDGGLLLPGLQPRELFNRVVTKLRGRRVDGDADGVAPARVEGPNRRKAPR